MGRLAGFSYREVTRRLRAFGFELSELGKGRHEVWLNRATRNRTVLVRHSGDIKEGTLRSILNLADISIDDFLA